MYIPGLRIDDICWFAHFACLQRLFHAKRLLPIYAHALYLYVHVERAETKIERGTEELERGATCSFVKENIGMDREQKEVEGFTC